LLRLQLVRNRDWIRPFDRLPENRVPVARLRRNVRGDNHGLAAVQGELERDSSLAALEAILVAADEPLMPRRLASLMGISDLAEIRRLIRKLSSYYEQDGTAFQVKEIAGGYQLFTRPEFHPWISRVRQGTDELRLSAAARETLAIVAYRQPIMRTDVEGIRGVQCGEMLRQLMEKGLVRVAGRHDSLGRPVLYGTTRKFLQIFGLSSLKDLPHSDHFNSESVDVTEATSIEDTAQPP
jgi:segregation and condensation protein B